MLLNIFSNSIYDIWPNLDEINLNKIIDNYTSLIYKFSQIKDKLQDLTSIQSKYYTKLAENEKMHSEKELDKLVDIYNLMQEKITKEEMYISYKDKLLNELTFNQEKKWLKDNTNSYLNIYEQTYKNLTLIITERLKIFDFLIKTKKFMLNQIEDCEQDLKNFMKINLINIKKAKEFLNKYTRKYYEQKIQEFIDHMDIIFLSKKNKSKDEIINEENNIGKNFNFNNNTDNINMNTNNNYVNNKANDIKIIKHRYQTKSVAKLNFKNKNKFNNGNNKINEINNL